MAETTKFHIPTDSYTTDFTAHLVQEDNHRILFSGIFGSGKTTFLRDFFDKDTNSYEVFHLFPVNYQVATNADIFEYIKYDLLFHIISKGWIDENTEVTKSLALQFYLLDKGPSFLLNMLKSVPNKYVSKITYGIEKTSKFLKDFSNYYTEIKDDDQSSIESFVTKLDNTQGSIYELDVITQIICNALSTNKANKKTVLIIDDVDRIDPEHIFRILNIFSAHFDLEDESKNKFDFDKIILVCDIQNIRNIFHNKYGTSVDFSGYVDKFYSKKIYTFNLSKTIYSLINDIIAPIAKEIPHDSYKNQLHNNVAYLIHCFVELRIISLRDIEKFNNGKTLKYNPYDISKSTYIRNFELHIPIVFDILTDMLGNNNSKVVDAFDSCILHFKELERLTELKGFESHLLYDSALFIYAIDNEISDQKHFEFPHENRWNITCQISSTHNGRSKNTYTANLISYEQSETMKEPEFKDAFVIMKKAFHRYTRINKL